MATSRIEIYTSGDGHAHSRLDGTTYVCDAHRDALLEVISWDNGGGYTHHVVKLPEGLERQCGTGFDFTAMARNQTEIASPTDATAEQVTEAFKLGRQIGKRSVAEEHAENVALLKRVDDKLTELRELKARHAFTPSRIEVTMDDWLWQCTCGEQFIQLEGERIHAALSDHANGVEL